MDNLVTLCWKCHHRVHTGHLKVNVVEWCSKFEGSYTIKFEKIGDWET